MLIKGGKEERNCMMESMLLLSPSLPMQWHHWEQTTYCYLLVLLTIATITIISPQPCRVGRFMRPMIITAIPIREQLVVAKTTSEAAAAGTQPPLPNCLCPKTSPGVELRVETRTRTMMMSRIHYLNLHSPLLIRKFVGSSSHSLLLH